MSVLSQAGTGGSGDGSVVSQDQLVEQISQLHMLVQDMKDGFTGALQELASIQRDDQRLEEKIEENRQECQQQITELVQIVTELKTEFGTVHAQLQLTTETQQSMKEQIEYLQYERDLLLEELEKSGSISEKLRRSHQKRSLPPRPEVTVTDDTTHDNEGDYKDDKDKNIESTEHDGRPGDRADGESSSSQPLSPSSYSNKALADFTTTDDNLNYESDSSITQAATLSLTLSKSLHNKCVKSHISSDEEEEIATLRKQHNIPENRNEGSGASRNSSFGCHDGINRNLSTPAKQLIAESKRHEIAVDILETEKRYVTCLSILEQNFAIPLRQSSILPARDVNAIFPAYLSVFYQRHTLILKQLEERIHSRKYNGMLGDVFARLTDPSNRDLLQCYSHYVTDFPHSIEMINHWSKQSQKFRKFLKKQLSQLNSSNVGLATYLLAPLQRIPKYVLLLKQLLKYMEEDHPDYFYMLTAIQGLNDFINNMNTAIQDAFKILNNSHQNPSKHRDSDVSQLSSMSSSSLDLHKLNHSSTALSVSSHKDSGVHSMGPSIDDIDLDFDLDQLLPDNGRSSLDKLKKYKLYRKSVSDDQRHSSGRYSSEDINDKMTLSFQLNATPVESQIRKRRKDKSHGRSRHKEGQEENGRTTPSRNMYNVPSRSATDTQLNVSAMTGGETSLPQSHSMYDYYTLPNKDGYASHYQNYSEQPIGASYVDRFDESKYSSMGFLDLTPPEQYTDQGNHQFAANNVSGDPNINVEQNHWKESETIKMKQKPIIDKRKSLPVKRPSFGIYGNKDADGVVYTPSQPGKALSRAEQVRREQLEKEQQMYQREQELQQTPVRDITSSPAIVDPRYHQRPRSKTPVSMGRNSPYPYNTPERSKTPTQEQPKPQVVTGVWEDENQLHRKKNKNKPTKYRQKNYEAGEKSAKRASLRNSLRTIFFKRSEPVTGSEESQSSRVVEFGSPTVMNNGQYTNTADTEIGANHHAASPIPMTYEDENGDPCSAV